MRPYLTTTALTTTAATVGSIGTRPDSAWYRSLEKPDWQPPSVAFPLVWTPLYGAIAWGTGRALDRAPARHDRKAAAALVPYAAWTGFATALNLAIWRRNR